MLPAQIVSIAQCCCAPLQLWVRYQEAAPRGHGQPAQEEEEDQEQDKCDQCEGGEQAAGCAAAAPDGVEAVQEGGGQYGTAGQYGVRPVARWLLCQEWEAVYRKQVRYSVLQYKCCAVQRCHNVV